MRWASPPPRGERRLSQARNSGSSWAPFLPSLHGLHTQPPGQTQDLATDTTGIPVSPAQVTTALGSESHVFLPPRDRMVFR